MTEKLLKRSHRTGYIAICVLVLYTISSQLLPFLQNLKPLPLFVREEHTIFPDPEHGLRPLDDHNIDIDPLHRAPTLHPNETQVLRRGLHGAISSDLELCNELAVKQVLTKFPGSNAADASVTLGLCIGMINFFNSGIGGGGYAVFTRGNKHETGQEEDHMFFDFRETAPVLAHKHMYENQPNASKFGGLAIAVPGELAGLYELYQLKGSGKVTWSDLLDPVADLGLNGWIVGDALGASLKLYEPYFLQNGKDWSFVLNEKRTSVKKAGEWINRPALANVLIELARNGSAAPFYDPEHWIVKSMVKKIGDSGGIITEDDFADYRVGKSPPLSLKIRSGFEHVPNNDLQVYTSSGSSSGAALISALSIMDHFPSVQGGDYLTEQSYQLIECMKWMASARSRLGDFGGTEDLPQRIREVLDDSWISEAANSIKEHSTGGQYRTLPHWSDYHPMYEMNDPHGTAHFSVVDEFNNAVSFTTTVNLLFGSLVHDPATGVIFNNEMDDFSQPGRSNSFGLAPSVYNFPEPGKRPLSSTAPTVILNELGQPGLIVGASGGSRITTSVFQTIVRNYWYNMPLLESIAYPRVHHQLLPDVIEIESLSMVGKEAVTALEKMGHVLLEQTPKSVVNAIKRSSGEWHAVSDYWRKRGVSVAY